MTSTAATIAAQLGETERIPQQTIWRCVRVLGPERAQAFVAQALEVEANGGMLIPDGSRKRTLGGIFFYLVRTQVSDDEAMQINRAWRWQQWKQRQPAKPKSTAAPAPLPLPPFVWDEAQPIITELTANVGEATTVKMTVRHLAIHPGPFATLREQLGRRLRSTIGLPNAGGSYGVPTDTASC